MTPLPIGIVGLNFGRHIIDELQREPAKAFFRIAAVCDLDAAKAADFGQRLGVPALTSLDELLSRADIPVIGLYTGPFKRAELLRKIIRAGKDVMTTKPFELDPQAARSVLEEAKALGRTIHLNSPCPVVPDWVAQIEKWQTEYDLGRPISCRAEVVVSYREKADGSWFDDANLCPAAPVFRLGIYLINDMVRIFGAVESVQVQTTRVFTGRPTADNAQLGLVFKNQALGSIYATFCVDDGQYYANSFWIHFERGTVLRNIEPVAYGTANLGTRMQLVAKRGERTVEMARFEKMDDGSDYQWDALYRAVTEHSVGMPIDHIVHGVQVIAAMNKAEQSGCSEPVNG